MSKIKSRRRNKVWGLVITTSLQEKLQQTKWSSNTCCSSNTLFSLDTKIIHVLTLIYYLFQPTNCILPPILYLIHYIYFHAIIHFSRVIHHHMQYPYNRALYTDLYMSNMFAPTICITKRQHNNISTSFTHQTNFMILSHNISLNSTLT